VLRMSGLFRWCSVRVFESPAWRRTKKKKKEKENDVAVLLDSFFSLSCLLYNVFRPYVLALCVRFDSLFLSLLFVSFSFSPALLSSFPRGWWLWGSVERWTEERRADRQAGRQTGAA
jgi:hypothetical protein